MLIDWLIGWIVDDDSNEQDGWAYLCLSDFHPPTSKSVRICLDQAFRLNVLAAAVNLAPDRGDMPCGGAGCGDDRGKWASIPGMLELYRACSVCTMYS